MLEVVKVTMTPEEKKDYEKFMQEQGDEDKYWQETVNVPLQVKGVRVIYVIGTDRDLLNGHWPMLSMKLNGVTAYLTFENGKLRWGKSAWIPGDSPLISFHLDPSAQAQKEQGSLYPPSPQYLKGVANISI